MSTVTSMKCACDKCLCVISIEDAIVKDGKSYCSKSCANGHVNNEGCGGNSGCGCS